MSGHGDDGRRRGRPLLAVVAVAVALLSLVGGLAFEADAGQRRAAAVAENRFQERIRLAASYVQSHVAELGARQMAFAQTQLEGPSISPDQFDDEAAAFGFRTAVLLDARGTVLAVSPQKADLVGTEVASQRVHLSAAENGRDAVSGVVLSLVDQKPIVAVAVPFQTPQGRRVLSGGYELAESPLAQFLGAASSLRGRELYLVDDDYQVIAGTDTGVGGLDQHAPALVGAPVGISAATQLGQEHVVVVAPVSGTPWQLIAAVPRDELLAPVQGTAGTLWALVVASAALALGVVLLLVRVSLQRDRLRRVSRTDALTGLANRGRADEVMVRAAAVSERTKLPWAVAMIDVDRFKSVNDRWGHAGGDRVLQQIASVLADQVRTSDVCARWGGEEFILVMEATDLDAATAAGARIVQAVREVRTDDGEPVSVSVGTAAALGGDVDAVVHRADDALYRAKRAGRNRVVASGSAVVVALSRPSTDGPRGTERPPPVPQVASRR